MGGGHQQQLQRCVGTGVGSPHLDPLPLLSLPLPLPPCSHPCTHPCSYPRPPPLAICYIEKETHTHTQHKYGSKYAFVCFLYLSAPAGTSPPLPPARPHLGPAGVLLLEGLQVRTALDARDVQVGQLSGGGICYGLGRVGACRAGEGMGGRAAGILKMCRAGQGREGCDLLC